MCGIGVGIGIGWVIMLCLNEQPAAIVALYFRVPVPRLGDGQDNNE